MAKQRIVNARNAPPPGQRGKEEKRGPVEFSDRYRGPQTRLQTEGTRSTAPHSERSVTKSGVAAGSTAPAVTKSEGQKERVTSPSLATQRVTLPTAARAQAPLERAGEASRQSQPESRDAQQQAQQIATAQRPVLRETFPRGEAEQKKPASSQTEGKAFAGGPGGFIVEPAIDSRRRAAR